jgi:glucokinase
MTNYFLCADIGGTKTTLAIVSENHKFVKEGYFLNAKFFSFEELLFQFLNGEKVVAAVFGVAGKVEKEFCKVTNLPWTLNLKDLKYALKTEDVFFLNDLEAIAYGIESVSEDKLIYINRGEASSFGVTSIIAPGTGLGESFIYNSDEKMIVFPTEGGHADFAAASSLEVEVYEKLQKIYGHVSYERILSGDGISFLESFFSKREKKPAEVVFQNATNGEQTARKAFEFFFNVLARESSNLALKTLSGNGVYISGGIIRKSFKLLNYETFLSTFLDKGRFSSFLKKVPIKIVLEEKINLFGAINFYKKLQ